MELLVFSRRVYQYLISRLLALLALLALFLMALIRPYKTIMIGELRDRTLGDLYIRYSCSTFLLAQKSTGSRAKVLWFFRGPKPANTQANSNFEKSMSVVKGILWPKIWEKAHTNRFFYPHVVPHPEFDSGRILPEMLNLEGDFFSKMDQSIHSMPMTLNSNARFKVLTEQLGIEQDRPIICLDVRNSDYKRYQLPIRDGTSGMKLESLLRSQEHRNSTINQFQYAIEYLVAHGYAVIRLGMPRQDETKLPSSGFVDYANSALRSPLNDLLLLENSDFLISTVSGPMEVARSLRKKTLALDVGSLNILNQSQLSAHTIPIVLPKVIVDVDTGKPVDGSSLKSSGMLRMNHRELSRFLTTSESYKMVSNSQEAIKQTVELFFTNAIGNAQHPELKVGKELYIQNFGQICCTSCTPCLSPYWINSQV